MDDTGEKEREIQTREFEENNPNFRRSSWEKVFDAAMRGRYEGLSPEKINSMSRFNVIIDLPFEAFGARLASKIFECSRRPTMTRKEGATFREKKSRNQLKKRPRLNASQKARKKLLNRSWRPREHANEMVLLIEPSLRCLYQDSMRMPLLLTIRE